VHPTKDHMQAKEEKRKKKKKKKKKKNLKLKDMRLNLHKVIFGCLRLDVNYFLTCRFKKIKRMNTIKRRN